MRTNSVHGFRAGRFDVGVRAPPVLSAVGLVGAADVSPSPGAPLASGPGVEEVPGASVSGLSLAGLSFFLSFFGVVPDLSPPGGGVGTWAGAPLGFGAGAGVPRPDGAAAGAGVGAVERGAGVAPLSEGAPCWGAGVVGEAAEAAPGPVDDVAVRR